MTLEAADTGNTIASLSNDIELAAQYIDFVAGLGMEIKGESVPATPDNIHFTMREPYGASSGESYRLIIRSCLRLHILVRR